MLKFDSFIWGQFCKFIKLNTVNSFLFPFCLFVLLWSLKKILFKFFLQPVHCFHFSFPKSFRSPASQKNKMCTVKITLRTYRQDKAISCYPQSWEKFILVFASLTFVCCSCLFPPPLALSWLIHWPCVVLVTTLKGMSQDFLSTAVPSLCCHPTTILLYEWHSSVVAVHLSGVH